MKKPNRGEKAKMNELNNITTKEAIWLIISQVNHARQNNTEINIDKITPKYIHDQLQSYRSIEAAYSDMRDAILNGKNNKFTEIVKSIF